MYKRIGILGGLTPESTVPYYMHIIHRYEELYHSHAYPEVIVFSVSFQRFEDWMAVEDWDSMELELAKGLKSLNCLAGYMDRSGIRPASAVNYGDFAILK